MGVEPITPILQGSVASIGSQAQLQRSVRDLNPILVLTTDVCCQNTYRPYLTTAARAFFLPFGRRPGLASRMELNHRLPYVEQVSSPLDHGIKLSVTEVGIEPTESRGSRPRRFSCLRTRS